VEANMKKKTITTTTTVTTTVVPASVPVPKRRLRLVKRVRTITVRAPIATVRTRQQSSATVRPVVTLRTPSGEIIRAPSGSTVRVRPGSED
jgi:hypothetical protein